MPTLNYTTKVPVAQTIAAVQSMLAEHGADAVAVMYENREPCGLSFKLTTPHGPRAFSLPVDTRAVQRLLVQQSEDGKFRSDGYRNTKMTTPEHAARVAWRVLKDWLEAQLAMIEAQLVAFDQVMLPFMHVGELTVYESYVQREDSLRAIEASH